MSLVSLTVSRGRLWPEAALRPEVRSEAHVDQSAHLGRGEVHQGRVTPAPLQSSGLGTGQNGFTSSSICSTILPQSVLRNLNFPVSPMTFSCCVSVLSTNGYGFALLLPHEGLHLLKGHFAVLVGVDPIKDPLMDGHHLLEGECPVPVRVDNGEHDLHHVSTRTHHRHSAHHAVSHHARAHHPRASAGGVPG